MATLHLFTSPCCSAIRRPACGLHSHPACLKNVGTIKIANIAAAAHQLSWSAPANTVRPCRMACASSADSMSTREHSPSEHNQQHHNSLSRDEVEKRVRKAANLMIAADKLAPFDRRVFNPGLVLWKAIADIPQAERKTLLRYLLPKDIERLWRISGEKYRAKRQDLIAAMGPDWSIWDDVPSEPDQVIRYRGRAAVPLPGLLGGFSKVFFAQPKTFELYGRVKVHRGPLGDLLYPLYFKCNIGPSRIPATGEMSDMQLEYLSPEQLRLLPSDVPKTGRWPRIRAPKWPFNADLVDHVRAVGPGVYVGVGWKAPREDKVELGRRFLPFMLVREYEK